jgi:hypothetical protein
MYGIVEYILQAMWKQLSVSVSVSSPMKYKKLIHMTKNTMNTVLIVLFLPRIQYMRPKVKEINY